MIQKSERIVRYTAEELDEKRKREGTLSDWTKFDAMTEEELEASIDIEEEGLPIWSTLRTNRINKKLLTLRLDADVIFWFKLEGKGYQSRMNAVLRSYMEDQQRKQSRT